MVSIHAGRGRLTPTKYPTDTQNAGLTLQWVESVPQHPQTGTGYGTSKKQGLQGVMATTEDFSVVAKGVSVKGWRHCSTTTPKRIKYD
jgi:hypothetical protein